MENNQNTDAPQEPVATIQDMHDKRVAEKTAQFASNDLSRATSTEPPAKETSWGVVLKCCQHGGFCL